MEWCCMLLRDNYCLDIVEKQEKEERIIDHRKKIYKFQSME